MATSQNGWPVLKPEQTHQWQINRHAPLLRLERGAGGFVLAHFALWFGENIERIRGDTLDDWGWAVRPIRGTTRTVSNHASGTAMDINALSHPLASRDTFTNEQAWRMLRRLRGRYGGAIRWGGQYEHRADEMHFELACDRAGARALARLLAVTERGQRVRRLNAGVPLA
jgi:hypothetical protein